MFRGLGRSFRTRLNSKHAKPDDLTQARRSFLCALQEKAGYPDRRLRAGLEYVDLLSHPTSPSSSKHALLQAYEHALNLVPPLTWFGDNIRKRDDQPVDLAAIYNRAAADAIAAGDYVQALEWLENGRTTMCFGRPLRLMIYERITFNLLPVSSTPTRHYWMLARRNVQCRWMMPALRHLSRHKRRRLAT